MGSSPCSVLVADPYPDCAAGLADRLAASGHKVRVAHTAADALRLAADEAPDIVVSEARFSDMDGFALVERIRGQVPGSVVCVMVTGRHDLRDRASGAGFDHFFVKPADPNDLARLVDEIERHCPDQEGSPAHA